LLLPAFSVIRNVPLPDGLEGWAHSAEGTGSLVDAAIGVKHVSLEGGLVKLHGDDIEDVDRAVRGPHKDVLRTLNPKP
jgi:hypothetical protein